jgi:nucleoside-diphosphate-sugar epimerase
MKVLLTGGLGFIGRRFIENFQNFHDLVIFTTENSIKKFNSTEISKVTVETGSIEDNSFQKIMLKHKPEVVIHLAAKSGLKNCEENPDSAFNCNVFGTYNVIKTCAEINSKLIFISSREVYGETINESTKEDDPLLPNNIYGITKMLAERLIINISQKYNVNYIILRLTNLFGPGVYERGVNRIIKMAVKDKKIQIYGGEQAINIVYVDDVVELINLILCEKCSWNEIFNVGSNNTLKIKKFVDEVKKLVDDVDIEYLPARNIENFIFNPNLEKIQREMKFTTKTSLIDGIQKTIKWIKSV